MTNDQYLQSQMDDAGLTIKIHLFNLSNIGYTLLLPLLEIVVSQIVWRHKRSV